MFGNLQADDLGNLNKESTKQSSGNLVTHFDDENQHRSRLNSLAIELHPRTPSHIKLDGEGSGSASLNFNFDDVINPEQNKEQKPIK